MKQQGDSTRDGAAGMLAAGGKGAIIQGDGQGTVGLSIRVSTGLFVLSRMHALVYTPSRVNTRWGRRASGKWKNIG